MKFFISLLLPQPAVGVLLLGLKIITGLSTLWCLPIAAILLLCFIKGYEMSKEVTREV
jgi:hypothetical protein